MGPETTVCWRMRWSSTSGDLPATSRVSQWSSAERRAHGTTDEGHRGFACRTPEGGGARPVHPAAPPLKRVGRQQDAAARSRDRGVELRADHVRRTSSEQPSCPLVAARGDLAARGDGSRAGAGVLARPPLWPRSSPSASPPPSSARSCATISCRDPATAAARWRKCDLPTAACSKRRRGTARRAPRGGRRTVRRARAAHGRCAPTARAGASPEGLQRAGENRRPLLDEDVRVGAAKAKGVHACEPRSLPAPPGHALGGDRERKGLCRDARVQALHVKMGRDLLVPEREQHLDQPDHAGGRLQVADVRLHRAEQAALVRAPGRREHRPERPRFDRVREHGADAVRLDVIDIPRLDPRLVQRSAEDGLERARVRRGQARPRPSWLTAEPRTTPKIVSPSWSASVSRFSTTTPQPSPRP